MSSAYNKVNQFVADVGNGIHDLNSNNLNFALYNTAPTATTTVYSSTNEVANGNGYTTGGDTIGSTAYSQTSGIAALTGSNVTWTATGSVGPLRYALLYNSTASGKNAMGYYDYGGSVTLASAETFTINVSGGILDLQ